MEYADFVNQTGQANAYSGRAIGASLGGISGAMDAAKSAPRTIASAASRLDTLNERLAKASDALSGVCSQIGALTALNQLTGGNTSPQAVSSGAVNRLNDSADDAHAKLATIEAYIASIQRALG